MRYRSLLVLLILTWAISWPVIKVGVTDIPPLWCACWRYVIVFVRSHRFTTSALSLAPWQMLVAAVLLLPVAMTVEGRPGSIGAGGVASLAYVGPVATAFAYWAVVETGRHLRASTMSIALLATPSLGILISTLTLGETVGASLVAGVVLIGTGIRLAAIAPKGADAASVPRAASAPIELSRLDSARVSRCKREL